MGKFSINLLEIILIVVNLLAVIITIPIFPVAIGFVIILAIQILRIVIRLITALFTDNFKDVEKEK